MPINWTDSKGKKRRLLDPFNLPEIRDRARNETAERADTSRRRHQDIERVDYYEPEHRAKKRRD